ncbi:MAG: hypothetical protein ABL921_11490 [Pirellula sp.]
MTFRFAGFALSIFMGLAIGVRADDPILFRTDENPDKKLPWFQLQEGQFPPKNSSHAISGELIQLDHLERSFRLRVDRNDSQDRGIFDLPLDATMLPYGSIYYRGAPAALQDIPLGTHMHGLFYLKAADDRTPPPVGPNARVTPDVHFRRCFRLEDDFSHFVGLRQLWRIDALDLGKGKLTATLNNHGESVGPSKVFDLVSSTRVFVGKGFGTLGSIEVGQLVQLNLTWATLYGPGRIQELWLDEESRQIASSHQLEVHRNHIRERGLAGWVTQVDDEKQLVTIVFFGGVDESLFQELSKINESPIGWPLAKEPENQKAPKGTIAVAIESLMTYDPVNDRKGGNIISIESIAAEPGSSGVRIQVKCDIMLEGFRPRRIVRFYPASWRVVALPREEQYFGRE